MAPVARTFTHPLLARGSNLGHPLCTWILSSGPARVESDWWSVCAGGRLSQALTQALALQSRAERANKLKSSRPCSDRRRCPDWRWQDAYVL